MIICLSLDCVWTPLLWCFEYNFQFKTISGKKMITKLTQKRNFGVGSLRDHLAKEANVGVPDGKPALPAAYITTLTIYHNENDKSDKKSTLECPPPQQDQPSEDISRSTEQPCDQKMWWHKDHKKDESRNNTCLLGVQRVAAARLWVRVTPCLMLLLSNALGKSDWRCCLVPIANTVHNIQATSHCTDECLPC